MHTWEFQSRFFVALRMGKVMAVKDFLATGQIDVDVPFQVGGGFKPALCIAVEAGNIAMCELLLDAGCSVNQRDFLDYTPLHHAVLQAGTARSPLSIDVSLRLLRLLLSRNANVNAKGQGGETPLHLAVGQKQRDIIDLLLQAAEPDVNSPDGAGKTPLMMAVECGADVNIIARLLQTGADATLTDRWGRNVVHYAVRSEDPSAIAQLDMVLAASRRVGIPCLQGEHLVDGRDELGLTPLLRTALITKHGSSGFALEMTRLLLSHGANPDAQDVRGNTALHHAAEIGSHGIVELLLHFGADPRVGGPLPTSTCTAGSIPWSLYFPARGLSRREVESLQSMAYRVLRRQCPSIMLSSLPPGILDKF